jgi:hypothetical protein
MIGTRRGFALACALVTLVSAGSARAFERQWHVGAAAGVSNAQTYSLSPAVGLYGAYGLSDVFDARLELTLRGYELTDAQNASAAAAMLGIAYKIDVIRWVPWVGLFGGYLGALKEPPADAPFPRHGGAVGVGLGMDYALTRKLGFGLTLRYDQVLSDADGRVFDALLRAEYRWGF